MSLSTALTVALSGLQASTTAAQTISGNISNAQTPGYTDKSISLAPSSNGSSFGGVEVTGYTRVTDAVLSSTMNNATSTASYLSTQSGYMGEVQSTLDSSSNPPAFASAVSNFQSAWIQFSAAPNDAVQQKAVITAGQQLTSVVTTVATQMATLQSQIQGDLSTTVQSLNAALVQVQNLNTQIAAAVSNNQPTVNLQDQRDQIVTNISAMTNVQIMPRPNDGIALYTPGGATLVDGAAQVFSVGSGANNIVNAIGADVTSTLTGGKLQAQTDFLGSPNNTTNGVGVIGKVTSQLQNYINMFVNPASGGFANTYNTATTNTGELSSNFFTASLDSNGLPTLSSFSVNSSLLAGTSAVKQAAGVPIANTFTATNLAINGSSTSGTFTASGITISNQSYANIATSILSGMQQMANAIKASSTTATTQQTYYQNALSSKTGVNTDTELVNLTNWQNAYAASAHVISTIESMLKTLESM